MACEFTHCEIDISNYWLLSLVTYLATDTSIAAKGELQKAGIAFFNGDTHKTCPGIEPHVHVLRCGMWIINFVALTSSGW